MVERLKRKRAGDKSNDTSHEKIFTSEPSAPANAEDKRLWKGFCEIESEPVCSLPMWIFISHCLLMVGSGLFQCYA